MSAKNITIHLRFITQKREDRTACGVKAINKEIDHLNERVWGSGRRNAYYWNVASERNLRNLLTWEKMRVGEGGRHICSECLKRALHRLDIPLKDYIMLVMKTR